MHAAPGRRPARIFAHYADVPEDASVDHVSEERLPANWQAYPAPEALQGIGTKWAASRKTLLLAVPSAVLRVAPELVRDERVYLVDPAHREFGRVRVGSVRVLVSGPSVDTLRYR